MKGSFGIEGFGIYEGSGECIYRHVTLFGETIYEYESDKLQRKLSCQKQNKQREKKNGLENGRKIRIGIQMLFVQCRKQGPSVLIINKEMKR